MPYAVGSNYSIVWRIILVPFLFMTGQEPKPCVRFSLKCKKIVMFDIKIELEQNFLRNLEILALVKMGHRRLRLNEDKNSLKYRKPGIGQGWRNFKNVSCWPTAIWQNFLIFHLNILERALLALASSYRGAWYPGHTWGQPRWSTPGVRGWF